MITGESLDRRFWIGASDTKMVMANHNTHQWKDWWAVKMGFIESNGHHFSNKYTRAGDIYEKPIARYFGEDITEDRTIILPDYSLRVNLDADVPNGDNKKIIECKTFKIANGRLDVRSQAYKAYYMQIQVQLFAWEMYFGERISAEMRIYYVDDDDYFAADHGYALELDPNRIDRKFIEYNKSWIDSMYLPNLLPLSEALKAERKRQECG